MSDKIGIFGGTFDPIHFGHLITAQSVLEKRELGKLIFMPCFISPLKTEEYHLEGIHRYSMIKLALEGKTQFEVSDYELKKGDISYTFDTVSELKKKYAEIELIIGYDNLLVFEKWKNPDELFDLAKIIVLKRLTDNSTNQINRFFDKAVFIDNPTIEISSSLVRERIKSGLPIDYLVPENVKEYIYNNRLYK